VKAGRYGLLASVIVVSLLFLTVQARGGGPSRAGDIVAIVLTPVQDVLVKVHRGAAHLWASYADWKAVRRDNATLRAETEHLRVLDLQREETEQENARLRRLLGLRERLPLAAVAGEVIGRESGGWVRALTVNRGRGSGVVQQTPVIVPAGLVGRIAQVRSGASVVQLLTDPASTVGALVQRTRTPGLVEGDAAGAIRFKFMARDGSQVAAGDLIVTSGFGNVFPKGLPIGRIVAVEDKGSALFHFGIVAPAVDFARVEEVLLLTGSPATHDVADLFARGG
jgi:rod shape-determining protein MreC